MDKILLLDLGTPREELCEPLGIEVVAGYLDAIDLEFSLALQSLEIDHIIDIRKDWNVDKYDIVGISTKINSFERLTETIRVLYEINNNILIILGDVIATFAYDKILKIFPNVICVRGEGEEVMPEIVRCFQIYKTNLRKYLSKIPNLAYKHGDKIIKTQRCIVELSKAKSPRRHFLRDILCQFGIALIESSRGCIYDKCSFCGIPEKYNNSKWRVFSLEFVLRELCLLSNSGIKFAYFTDEDFFGNDVERVYNFCERVIDYKQSGKIASQMNFYLNARVDSILGNGFNCQCDPINMLNLLKKAGLREVAMGIETGCKDQVVRYNKRTTMQKSIKAINLLREMDIDVDVGFIFFDPYATLKDLRENINFIYTTGLYENSSRLIKRLRIQPFTQFSESLFKSSQHSRFDLDSVSYHYGFLHNDVAEIYDRVRRFEEKDLVAIYNMQSFCRGEVIDEDERREIRKKIIDYRRIHISFLNSLITAYENGNFSEKYLEKIAEDFDQKRQEINKTIDIQKWYDSKYRRFMIK